METEMLAKHITARLARRAHCLVFMEQFADVWPPVKGKKPAEERMKTIKAFASQHGWSVAFDGDRLKFKKLSTAPGGVD